MIIELAVKESLTALKDSLATDLQMVRNFRTELVKKQQLDKVSALKDIEQRITELMQTIESVV